MKAEHVAVVVVGYQGQEDIERLFASLAQAQDIWRVYFMDNTPGAPLAAWVTKHSPKTVVLPSQGNTGFAHANNALMAAAAADGADVFLLLNPDTTIEPDLVPVLREQAAPRRILQPLIIVSEDGVPTEKVNTWGNPLHPLGFSYAGGHGKPVGAAPAAPSPITIASGAACWIPVELVEEIGTFDEHFFLYHEDADLSWRARMVGAEIMLVPAARVYHNYTFSRNPGKFFYAERNRLMMLVKNYRLWTLLWLIPFGVITEIALLLYSVIGGFFVHKLRAYGAFVIELPYTLRERRRVQRLRKVSDRRLMRTANAKLQFSEVETPLLIPYNWFSLLYTKLLQLIVF